jgi:hypothetical protein
MNSWIALSAVTSMYLAGRLAIGRSEEAFAATAVFALCSSLFLVFALRQRLSSFGCWLRANPVPFWLAVLATAAFLGGAIYRSSFSALELLLNGLLAFVFYLAFMASVSKVRLWLK